MTATGQRRLALVLLGAFVATFLVVNVHRLDAPFGDSHDGRNGAVWASASRCLRDHGVIASKFGALQEVTPGPCGGAYVDHPPLIVAETAVAELIGGQRPIATRGAAWLGTIAAIVLLWEVIQETGISPLAAAAGVALGLGCPMLAVYGPMLDTWIVGLPWALATFLLWQRQRNGRVPAAVTVAVVTVGTVATSWLGWLLVGLVVVVDALTPAGRRRFLRASQARIAGAVLGGVLVLAWIVWGSGSLSGLRAVFASRSGTGGGTVPSLATALSAVRVYWEVLFTPWQLVLGIPVVIAGLWARRTRMPVFIWTVCVAAWTLLFRDGAFFHDYWTYWATIPLALGFSAAFGAGLAVLERGDRLVAVGSAVALGAVGCMGLAVASQSNDLLIRGIRAGRLVEHAPLPPAQTSAWYFGSITAPTAWVGYDSGLPQQQLVTTTDVARVAAQSPADIVFVVGPRLRGADVAADPTVPCSSSAGRTYSTPTAAQLLSRLQTRCPRPTAGGS